MNEYATTLERQNQQLIDFLSGISDEEMDLRCDDADGDTVGKVATHLAHGYERIAEWLVALTEGSTTSSGESHAHPHRTIGRTDLIARFEGAGARLVGLTGRLTTEQLASVPPADKGITDGSHRLDQVLQHMCDHQLEHLTNMRMTLAR